MRKGIPVCVALLLLLAHLSYAQQHLVDSISAELKGTMPDSSRAMSMMRLAIDYEVVDTAKAYKAYRDAIQFAKEKKLYYQLGRIYQNQSFLYSAAANYHATKANLDTAVMYYRKSNHPNARLWEANAYGDLGNVLKLQNDLEQSVQYHLKCVALLDTLGLQDRLVTRYCNLSTFFGDIREPARQKEYADKAVSTARKTGKGQDLFMAYFILAHYYNMQHDSQSAKTSLDSARVYFKEQANIDIAFTYYLISGQVFRELNQLDSAFYFFEQCYKLSKTYNYGFGKAESKLQMGAVSILQKKYPEAEKYLLSGIAEAEAINHYNSLDEGYKYLSDIYAVTGRYKEAYEFFQKYKSINDSVVDLESKKYITNLERKYESEKKDVQLKLQGAQLAKKNALNYFLIGGAALLVIISLLFYRNVRQNQKLQQQRIRELEKAKQLTATEAILKGEEQERSRLAKDLHDGLGGMMSGIKYSLQTMKQNLIMTPENQQAFERNMDMLDGSISEMRRIAHNMMPEALVKFGLDTALNDYCSDVDKTGSLQVSYQSIGINDAIIPQTTAITIYRIVQELINNTMKHSSAKSVIVQVIKTEGVISITVEDDGKGLNPAILQQSKGIGWSNIQSRVSYLNGKLDVTSDAGKGTSVHIELSI